MKTWFLANGDKSRRVGFFNAFSLATLGLGVCGLFSAMALALLLPPGPP